MSRNAGPARGGDTPYDVIVIGGGPAGMIAAGRAAECGARVLLIEKNPTLGKKLRITGGGRCNITNAELDPKKFIAKLGKGGKALAGAFSRFGVGDAMRFFESHGLPLKIEENNRAFPVSDTAEDVWRLLGAYMRAGRVEVMSNTPVIGIEAREGRIVGVRTSRGVQSARTYILATGGKSRPETGSTGEGLLWLKELGHAVAESDLALVPIKIREQWVKKLSGVSLPQAKVSVFQDGKKYESRTGKMLFTHFGVSGPVIINMSKSVADLYREGPVELRLDLYPELDIAALDTKLLSHMSTRLNTRIKNMLGEIVPPRMGEAIAVLTKIDIEKQTNALTKEERLLIVRTIKALPMSVSGFMGVEKAVVTSGGVSVGEVDFKTMQSKLFPNLYLAGDVLNFDRPTGGYSLQICWSTGYIAGESAAIQHEPHRAEPR